MAIFWASWAPAQVAVEAWVRRYSSVTDSQDTPATLVTDHAGNVIVVGSTDDAIHGRDVLTIKYSSAGVPLWTNRYDGLVSNYEQAYAAAVDENDNIYVAGSSYNRDSNYDFLTMAFSSSGVPLWTNLYNGPANGEDQITAMAVDGAGRIIVTGYSDGIGVGSDYLTIAYSNSGVALWTNRYNGLASFNDRPNALGVDTNNNIYVTGGSYDGVSSDYLTIAYSSAGAVLWANVYDGPSANDDEASAIAVSSNGTVFVTGYSYDNNHNYDYATLAYSSAGVALWTNRYNGTGNNDDEAFAIALTSANDVVVTGISYGASTSHDYATIKYSAAGVPVWTNRYNGPIDADDEALAVATDSNGNAFVTGYSSGAGSGNDFLTIAYSSQGQPMWINRYNAPANSDDQGWAIAVGQNGNVFLTGISFSPSFDWVTLAYSSQGASLWTNFYNGPAGASDSATAVAVDPGGNVYVTGLSAGNIGGDDYATVAYSSSGVPLWTNRYDGPANSYDQAQAVAVDGNGHVFVTCNSTTNTGNDDYATIAYSSAGIPMWTNRYDGPGQGTDEPCAIAVHSSGKVFVTGYVSGVDGSDDYATLAYSTAGVPLWTNFYSSPAGGYDRATGLALDVSGNVFVTGYAAGFDTQEDYLTIAYSSTGVLLWTSRYDNATVDDHAQGIAVDAAGNAFVTGYSNDIEGNVDYLTIKYSGAGLPLWTNRYDGSAHGEDRPQAIAVGPNGNVFVTGNSTAADGTFQYLTIAYSNSGLPLWTNVYQGSPEKNSFAQAVVVDPVGTIYVTGSSRDAQGVNDFATIAYSSAGVPMWTNRYNGPFNGDDAPLTSHSLAVAGIGSVVVVGESGGTYVNPSGIPDYAIVKYATFPSLSIARTGASTALISWQAVFTGYNLQQNTTLNTTSWSAAPEPVNDDGTNKFVMVNPAGPQLFFRLQKP